ncbi:MAG TPA: MFS transporter [Ktedonobacterales bacterium]
MTQRREQAGSYLRQFWRMNRNARLYLLSNTFSSITVGIFALLYNLYLVALGYQADFIGLLLVVGAIGGALGMLMTGPLIGHWGEKAVLFWSSVVAAIAGTLQLLIPVTGSLLITSFVFGVAGGIYLVIGAPLLAGGSQESSRSHIFSLNASLALVTTVIGQALGGYLPDLVSLPAIIHSGLLQLISPLLVSGAQARSYELALLLAGLIAAPSFIPILMMDPTPPARQHPAVALALPALPLFPRLLQQLQEMLRAWPRERVIRMTMALLRGPIGRLAIVEGLIGLGAGLFIPYFNLYFVDHLGISTAFYGLITAISTLLMALATLVGPFFAARLGKVRGTVIAHLASLPFLVTLGFAHALPLVLAAYLVRWSLMNMADPVLLSFFMGVVKPEERATANSAYNLSFYGFWAIGGALGGQIIAAGNYTLPFGLAATLYLAAALLLWRFFGHTQELSPSSPEAQRERASVIP